MRATENDIRTLSYFLWEQEGRPEGRSLDYWLRAEAELQAEEARMKPRKPRRAARRAPQGEVKAAAFETVHAAPDNSDRVKN